MRWRFFLVRRILVRRIISMLRFLSPMLSVANNYFTFSIFVFGDRPKTGAMRYLAGFMLNYLFAAAAVGFFADILGINPYISGILAMPIIAALSFVLHNWFVFREARR